MKTPKLLITIILSCILTGVYSQTIQSRVLHFMAVYNQIAVSQPGKYFVTEAGDSIKISTLKFYISDIGFQNKLKPVYKEKIRFHLVNVFDTLSNCIQLSKPVNLKQNFLQFSIGIDSATNAAGALSGALDPVNGMYWTWQSGYIHFKLEGSKKHGNEKVQNFQYHIGGYQFPYNSLRIIHLESNHNDSIQIQLELAPLFDKLNPGLESGIMSPGPAATHMADQISTIFSIRKNDP